MGNTSVRRDRDEIRDYMARHKVNHTTAVRSLRGAGLLPGGLPGDPYGGHVFDYEGSTDLFRCSRCDVYEVTARAGKGPIAPCAGEKALPGYGGDPERVYLLVAIAPLDGDFPPGPISNRIRMTGLGRSPRFSYWDGRILVETAPSVAAELTRQISELTYDQPELRHFRLGRMVDGVELLTRVEGHRIIADNYAAYVAKYGEPR